MNSPAESTIHRRQATDIESLPPLMTRAMVACLAHCHPRTVARAQALDLLPAARPHQSGSTRVLYRREDVLTWLGVRETA